MTDQVTPGVDVNVNGEQDVDALDERSVLLDQVRKRRQEILSTEYHKDMDIPGYVGMLVVRFRPFAVAKSERNSKSLRKRFEEGDAILLDSACQTLIDGCEQVMVRKDSKTDPMPIDDEVPVKFDARLAELLRIDLGTKPSARQVVKSLFPTEQGIIAMAMEVDGWLRDVTRETDETLMGE